MRQRRKRKSTVKRSLAVKAPRGSHQVAHRVARALDDALENLSITAFAGEHLVEWVASQTPGPLREEGVWHLEPLAHHAINPTTAHLLRVRWSGQKARLGMVVKVVKRPGPGFDENDWNYWAREFFAYKSGFLNGLPVGVRGPTVIGLLRPASSTAVMALGEVTDFKRRVWTVADYAKAAHHLGRLNAAYARHAKGTARPWLARHALERLAKAFSANVTALEDDALWSQRPFQDGFSKGFRASVMALTQELPAMTSALRQLPACVAHLDAGRGNLFAHPDAITLIDWQMVGTGALGEELVALVCGALVWSLDWPPSRALGLQSRVVDGYVRGLRSEGWKGSPQDVLQGYATSLRVRMCHALPYLMTLRSTAAHRRSWQHLFHATSKQKVQRWVRGIESVFVQTEDAALKGLLASL